MNKNRWINILVIIFGSSWLLLFPYYNNLWTALVNKASNDPNVSFQAFLGFFFLSIFLLTYIINANNVKRIAFTGMLLALAISLVMWLCPYMQAFYVGYALLGICVGTYYSAFALLFIFEFSSKLRVTAVSAFLLGSYCIVFFTISVFSGISHKIMIVIVSFLLVIACVFLSILKPGLWFDKQVSDHKQPFPLKIMLLTGMMVFIGYFNSRLIVNIAICKITENQFHQNLSFIVQIIICITLIFIGKRASSFAILYCALTCIGLTYVFSLLGEKANFVFYSFYIASATFKDIFVYSFISNLALKYSRNLNVLRGSILFVAAGSIIGESVGLKVYSFIAGNNTELYVISLLLLFVSMAVIPWVSKCVDEVSHNIHKVKETDLPAGDPGEISRIKDEMVYDRSVDENINKIVAFNLKLDEENKLTQRELEIVEQLFARLDYRTISENLFISQNTLKTHIKHIYKKLCVGSKNELIKVINS